MATTSRTAGKPSADAGGQMSLMEHLAELRRRLIISLMAVLGGAIVVWIFYSWIMGEVLLPPYCAINSGEEEIARECRLLITDPLEGLSVRMTIAGYGGIALAMPVILWQLWRFIAPGLYDNERRYGIIFVFCATVLFALGSGLAYWSVPRALEFLTEIGGAEFTDIRFSPQKYVNFITKMIVGFGVGFQFPIVLIFMQIIGLIDNTTLRSGRRYAVVGITILVAVLTPSGDPWTLLAMAIPMYLFYEVAILFGRWWNRRQARK